MVVGDLAWPEPGCLAIDEVVRSAADYSLVANLEGAIVDGHPGDALVKNECKFNLFSHREVVDVASSLNVVALGMANNHAGDYKGRASQTITRLKEAGINVFGIKGHPIAFVGSGNEYVIIGACAPITDISPCENGMEVIRFNARRLLQTIRHIKAQYPEKKIVVYVHWGYELAKFPLPADRQWARKAIASGCDYVIGHHPHVVQGIETYRDGIIAYSLGNFLLPQTKYRGRQLKYDDAAVLSQLGLVLGDQVMLQWYEYDVTRKRIRFESRTKFESDRRIDELTPFAGFSDAQYAHWYAAQLRAGTIRGRIGAPTFWSYFGLRRVDSSVKSGIVTIKHGIRKIAIQTGMHKPYNW